MTGFIKTDYVAGLKFDYKVKHLIFDITSDNIQLYYDGMKKIADIKYNDISDIQIIENDDIGHSMFKGTVTGALCGIAFGGLAAGLAGYTIGGFKIKKRYLLGIELGIDDNNNGVIIVAGDKSKIECLYYRMTDNIK